MSNELQELNKYYSTLTGARLDSNPGHAPILTDATELVIFVMPKSGKIIYCTPDQIELMSRINNTGCADSTTQEDAMIEKQIAMLDNLKAQNDPRHIGAREKSWLLIILGSLLTILFLGLVEGWWFK